MSQYDYQGDDSASGGYDEDRYSETSSYSQRSHYNDTSYAPSDKCSTQAGAHNPHNRQPQHCSECGYQPCRCKKLCRKCKTCPCNCHKKCKECKKYPCSCPPHCKPYHKSYKPKGGRFPPTSCNSAQKRNLGPVLTEPVTFAVGSGGNFESLDEALSFLKKQDSQSLALPPQGYRFILKNGSHRLKGDYHLDTNIVRLEAQSWDPTMGMSYIQGAGHAHSLIPQYTDQYQKNVGGLGKWQLDVCGSRVTVCGSINPNYGGLVCGDTLYWLNKKGKIICYTVSSAKCNSIWIKECFDSSCVKDGEGFWIANRSVIEPVGSRMLIVQDRLEYLGLSIQSAGSGGVLSTTAQDEEEIREGDRFLTGADAGHNQFSHGVTSERVSFRGNYDWPQPNVHVSLNHYYPSTQGYMAYQSFLGANARVHVEGSNVTHLGATYVGNEMAVWAFDTGIFATLGSCFMKCQLGVRNFAASTNYYGTMFDSCAVGAEAARSGKVTSRNQSLAGLVPPMFQFCEIALTFDDKSQGDSQTILTRENDLDLVLDGTNFNSLSDYTSGTQGSLVSSLYYEEHIEMS